MSTTAVRRRVSSAAASRGSPHIAEIKPLLDSLEAAADDPDILARLQWLALLKRTLVDSPNAKGTSWGPCGTGKGGGDCALTIMCVCVCNG